MKTDGEGVYSPSVSSIDSFDKEDSSRFKKLTVDDILADSDDDDLSFLSELSPEECRKTRKCKLFEGYLPEIPTWVVPTNQLVYFSYLCKRDYLCRELWALLIVERKLTIKRVAAHIAAVLPNAQSRLDPAEDNDFLWRLSATESANCFPICCSNGLDFLQSSCDLSLFDPCLKVAIAFGASECVAWLLQQKGDCKALIEYYLHCFLQYARQSFQDIAAAFSRDPGSYYQRHKFRYSLFSSDGRPSNNFETCDEDDHWKLLFSVRKTSWAFNCLCSSTKDIPVALQTYTWERCISDAFSVVDAAFKMQKEGSHIRINQSMTEELSFQKVPETNNGPIKSLYSFTNLMFTSIFKECLPRIPASIFLSKAMSLEDFTPQDRMCAYKDCIKTALNIIAYESFTTKLLRNRFSLEAVHHITALYEMEKSAIVGLPLTRCSYCKKSLLASNVADNSRFGIENGSTIHLYRCRHAYHMSCSLKILSLQNNGGVARPIVSKHSKDDGTKLLLLSQAKCWLCSKKTPVFAS